MEGEGEKEEESEREQVIDYLLWIGSSISFLLNCVCYTPFTLQV